jgi:hypothetical protein
LQLVNKGHDSIFQDPLNNQVIYSIADATGYCTM